MPWLCCEIGYNLFYYSVKLTSFTDPNRWCYTKRFYGLRLTGATSGVTAKVIGVDSTDGTDPNTLYVKYENSGTNNSEVKFTAVKQFQFQQLYKCKLLPFLLL